MAVPARKLEDVAEAAQVTRERQGGPSGKGGLVIRAHDPLPGRGAEDRDLSVRGRQGAQGVPEERRRADGHERGGETESAA